MAKTWYPINVYGFYVNEKSYYKLTDIAIGLQYKDVSLLITMGKLKNEQKLTPPPFRSSDETVN